MSRYFFFARTRVTPVQTTPARRKGLGTHTKPMSADYSALSNDARAWLDAHAGHVMGSTTKGEGELERRVRFLAIPAIDPRLPKDSYIAKALMDGKHPRSGKDLVPSGASQRPLNYDQERCAANMWKSEKGRGPGALFAREAEVRASRKSAPQRDVGHPPQCDSASGNPNYRNAEFNAGEYESGVGDMEEEDPHPDLHTENPQLQSRTQSRPQPQPQLPRTSVQTAMGTLSDDAGTIVRGIKNSVAGAAYDLAHWGDIPEDMLQGEGNWLSKRLGHTVARDDRPIYFLFAIIGMLVVFMALKAVWVGTKGKYGKNT